MGKRGPKPRPRLLDYAAKLAGDPIVPPADVADDPVALNVWRDTITNLRQLGTYHDADLRVVGRYACVISLWEQTLADVRKNGHAMKTRTGFMAPTPSSVLLLKLAQQALAMEQVLGASPRSRSRLKVATPHEPDPLDEFLATT